MMKKLSIIISLLLLGQWFPVNAEEIPIATETYSQTSPVVVHNGTQFFTGYIDRRGGGTNYSFYARFITNEGVVSTNDYLLVPNHNAMSIMNNMALGADNYLFSWSRQRGPNDYQRDAYARLINHDGTTAGNSFRVSSHNSLAANFLRAAFDGEKYLLIWQQGSPAQSATLMGQFISPTGTLIGTNFSIRPEDLPASTSQIYPDLLFDGDNFLIVWDDNRSGSRRIYGWFMDTDGYLIGDDFPIGDAGTANQLLVQAAFNGTHYMAVWADRRDGSKNGVYGQMFDNQGNLIGENLGISKLANSEERSWPRIGTNGSQFLVAWDRQTISKQHIVASPVRNAMEEAAGTGNEKNTIWYEVHGRVVNSNGSMPGDEFIIGANTGHQESPAIASDGEKFLTAWQDSRMNNQYHNIYGLFTETEEPPVVLHPPQNLQAIFEDGTVVLTWDPPADEKQVLHYNLYRNDVLLAGEIDDETFTDEDIEQLLGYTYFVTAVYQDGESEPSNVVEIIIPQMYVTIVFHVFEAQPALEEIPLEGVKITLETAGEAWTDEDGIAMFDDVPVAEVLSYSVEKEGYFPQAGTIDDVHEDMLLELFMEPDGTFTSETGQYNTIVWPIPAQNIINLRSGQTIEEVRMYNLTGKMVLSQPGRQTRSMSISIDHLHPGVYFMKVSYLHHAEQVYKIVVR